MCPICPVCATSLEWTEMEYNEEVFAPRTYMCNNTDCRELFTVSEVEIKKYQEMFHRMDHGSAPETPDDWSNLRKAWDSGNFEG